MCNDYTNAGGQPTAAVEQKQAAAQVLQKKAEEAGELSNTEEGELVAEHYVWSQTKITLKETDAVITYEVKTEEEDAEIIGAFSGNKENWM